MRVWLMIGLLAACGKAAKMQETLATASQTGDTVVRIEGDHAVVIADHQSSPSHLTAGGTQVAWASNNLTQLMGVAPTGGKPTMLAQATKSSVIQAVASDGTTIVCSMLGSDGGGVYLVRPDAPPRQLVEARASLVSVAGKVVYWIEKSDSAYLVKTTAF